MPNTYSEETTSIEGLRLLLNKVVNLFRLHLHILVHLGFDYLNTMALL